MILLYAFSFQSIDADILCIILIMEEGSPYDGCPFNCEK